MVKPKLLDHVGDAVRGRRRRYSTAKAYAVLEVTH